MASVEHDDCMMTTIEGFEKAAGAIKQIFVREKASGLWWTHH